MLLTFFPFDGQCSQLTWSPDGSLLAVVDEGRETFFLYDIKKKMRVPWILFPQRHQSHLLQNVGCLAWSPTGKSLAVTHKNSITIVEPRTGTLLHEITLPTTSIVSLSWSPTGHLLALTTRFSDYYEVAWHKNQEHGQALRCSPTSDALAHTATFVHGWLGGSKNLVPLCSNNRSLLTIDTEHGDQVASREAFDIERRSCAVSPSRRQVALASNYADEVALYTSHCKRGFGTVIRKEKIYQPEQAYLADHQECDRYDPASLVAWSQDGKYLATCFRELRKRIYIWDAMTGVTKHMLEANDDKEEVMSLAWGPGSLLCWGGKGSFQIRQIP
jgi:WD40 repeat protein